ncbi:MAG TPA: universal stress protein, partial [Candidatus Elarobacter sp.]|nr:universal stress protein [Candidatus Elarobacter sp.]
MDSALRLQRILVGIDFGSTSLAAARWVATHFASDAELALAHVIALPRIPSYLRSVVPPPHVLLDQIAPQARGGLRGFASTLGAGAARTELLVGIPSERLATCAEDLGADMVVVGRTHQSAGTWKRIGSTADRLIRQVRVPVLIATGALTEPPRRILAAVDDGEAGNELLRVSQTLAMQLGAELIALHVVSRRVSAYAAAAVPVAAHVGSVHTA